MMNIGNIKNIGTINQINSDGTVTRIVTNENDHISMKNGTIYINGKKLDNKNTAKDTNDIYDRAFKNPCPQPQKKQERTNGNFIEENYDSIMDNKGIIEENYGTIINNYGTVKENYGTIINNYGIIEENYGTVKNNSGMIIERY